MRLLIVDDDAIFREELADLLRDEGHQASVAPSVPKALEALEHEEVDVVFTDLKMPRQSGMELLREVRKRWPRTLVVMITGFATVETAIEAMKLGAFDYIRKPFQINQVQQTLQLVAAERKFKEGVEGARDAWEEARAVADGGRHEVLFFGEPPASPIPHIHVERLDPSNPSQLEATAIAFAREHPNAAVVISGTEKMLEDHKLHDILEILGRVRDGLEGHGPLRVGFDPRKTPSDAAAALGSVVAAKETHETLEALSSPIRRKALERLAPAPASFSEIMRAVGLDDSPKMSFHMRKLVDDGLVSHDGVTYRLTPRGESASRLLRETSALPPPGPAGNLAFPARRPVSRTKK